MNNQNVTKSKNSKERRQEIIDGRLALNNLRLALKSSEKINSNSLTQQSSVDRRVHKNRRGNVIDRRFQFDRRRGPGRRRSDERKDAEEGQMSDEQLEFLMAINDYKKQNTRPFPTWTEVLEVIKALGYRKVAEPQPLKPFKKEEPFSGNNRIG